uniref:BPI2 domain-containing protein n=1 Tax=Rhabditophanes sp. KR3021 TaxID=114890 RepID=A0AC35TNW0_9BILA
MGKLLLFTFFLVLSFSEGAPPKVKIPTPFGLGFNLAKFDFSQAVGMARNTQGVKFNIPKGYTMIPDMGVKITPTSNYLPIYTDKNGKVVTFDTVGTVIPVLFDPSGAPVSQRVKGKTFGGYKKGPNGKIIESKLTAKLLPMTMDVASVVTSINALGPAFPGYALLYGKVLPAKPAVSKVSVKLPDKAILGGGFDFKNILFPKAQGMGLIKGGLTQTIGPGLVMVPGMAVHLSATSPYFPVYMNVSTGAAVAFTNEMRQFNVQFDVNNIPVAIGPKNTFDGYLQSKDKFLKSIAKNTIKYSSAPLNVNKVISDCINLGPSFPGYYLVMKVDSSPILRMTSSAVNFNVGIDFTKVIIKNPVGMGKITKGLNLKIPVNFYMIPNYGVRMVAGGPFFPVYTNEEGDAVSFDDNNQQVDVKFDSNGVPMVQNIGTGNYMAGYKFANGQYIMANPKSATIQTIMMNVADIKKQAMALGPNFYGYFTVVNPQVNSITKKVIDKKFKLTGGTVKKKSSSTMNLALLFNIKGAKGVSKISGGLGISVSTKYLMMPNRGVRINKNGKYYPVYADKTTGQMVTFDDNGKQIEVQTDDSGLPVTVDADGTVYSGYEDKADGSTVYSATQKKYARGRKISIPELAQQIQDMGATFPGFALLQNVTSSEDEGSGSGEYEEGSGEEMSTTTPEPEILQPKLDLSKDISSTIYSNITTTDSARYITGGLNFAQTTKYMMVPNFGVQIPNGKGKYYPIYLDKDNKPIAMFENGTTMNVYFTDSGAPITVNPDSSINTGFYISNGSPSYSKVDQTYDRYALNPKDIKSTIEKLGPGNAAYYTIHDTVDLVSGLSSTLSTLNTTSSMSRINAGQSFNVPDGFYMMPGSSVTTSPNSTNYYPIYVKKDTGATYTFSDKGLMQSVYFDGQGAPVTVNKDFSINPGSTIINGSEFNSTSSSSYRNVTFSIDTVKSTIEKLGPSSIFFTSAFKPIDVSSQITTSIFKQITNDQITNITSQLQMGSSSPLPNYYSIPGMYTKLFKNSAKYYPVFVGPKNNMVSFDENGNMITVLVDSKGLPKVIVDNTVLTGFSIIDNAPAYSQPDKDYQPGTISQLSVVDTVEKLGQNYPGYGDVHKPVDVNITLQNVFKNIDAEGANIVSSFTCSVNISIPDGYFPIPGLAAPVGSKDNVCAVYANNVTGQVVTFGPDSAQIPVKFDPYGAPTTVSSDGSILPGYIAMKNQSRKAIPNSKLKEVFVNTTTIISAVTRLGPDYGQFYASQKPTDLVQEFTNVFDDLNPESALGSIDPSNINETMDGVTLFPAGGVQTPDSNGQYMPVYINDTTGESFTLYKNGTRITVLYDKLSGAPAAQSPDGKIYPGFISSKPTTKYSKPTSKLTSIIQNVTYIKTQIKRLGSTFKGFNLSFKTFNVTGNLDSILSTMTVADSQSNIVKQPPPPTDEQLYSVPGCGVQIDESGKYYPCFVNDDGVMNAFDVNNQSIPIYADSQNLPVTIDSSNKVRQGFMMINKVPQYSSITSKTHKLTMNTTTIIQFNQKLDPTNWAYIAPPSKSTTISFNPKNMDITKITSLIDVTPQNIPPSFISVPGMSVPLDSSGKRYPVYTNKDGTLYSFDSTGQNFTIMNDPSGAPVAIGPNKQQFPGFMIINGVTKKATTTTLKTITYNYKEVRTFIDSMGPSYTGFYLIYPKINVTESLQDIMENIDVNEAMGLVQDPLNEPFYTNSSFQFIPVPGFGVKIPGQDGYSIVFVDYSGNPFTFDLSQTPPKQIKVYSDEFGVPVTLNDDNSTNKGYIMIDKKPRFSAPVKIPKTFTLNVKTIKNQIEMLQGSFPGYIILNKPVDLINDLGNVLDDLTPISASLGVDPSSIQYREGYLIVPGGGVKLSNETDAPFYSIYVDIQNGAMVVFDEQNTMYSVFVDIRNVPIYIDRNNIRYQGFFYVNGDYLFSLDTGSFKQITLNVSIITYTIDNVLGPNYSGYISLHPLPDLNTILSKTYLTITIDQAVSEINAGRDINPPNYLMVPAMGIQTSDNGKYYPVYVDLTGVLFAFNDKLVGTQVFVDDSGAPLLTDANGIIRIGYILSDGELIYGNATSRMNSVTIDRNMVLDCINLLGFKYFGFIGANPNGVISGANLVLGNTKVTELKFGGSIDIPEGYAPIPELSCQVRKDNVYLPVIINMQGVAFAFDIFKSMYPLTFDPQGIPVYINDTTQDVWTGMKIVDSKPIYANKDGPFTNITFDITEYFDDSDSLQRDGYTIIENNLVSVDDSSLFYQLYFQDSTGLPYAFDDKNLRYFVSFDASVSATSLAVPVSDYVKIWESLLDSFVNEWQKLGKDGQVIASNDLILIIQETRNLIRSKIEIEEAGQFDFILVQEIIYRLDSGNLKSFPQIRTSFSVLFDGFGRMKVSLKDSIYLLFKLSDKILSNQIGKGVEVHAITKITDNSFYCQLTTAVERDLIAFAQSLKNVKKVKQLTYQQLIDAIFELRKVMILFKHNKDSIDKELKDHILNIFRNECPAVYLIIEATTDKLMKIKFSVGEAICGLELIDAYLRIPFV